jgi:hypothetical protein
MTKFFGLVLMSLVLLSCTESVEPKPYIYTEIFTGKSNKTWKLDRFIERKSGEADQQYGLDICQRDDLYVFYANEEKLFEVDNGNVICFDGDPDLLLSYTWEFNQANASLTMVLPNLFGYFIIPFTVKDVSKTDMELELFLNEEATISYVLFFKRVDEE